MVDKWLREHGSTNNSFEAKVKDEFKTLKEDIDIKFNTLTETLLAFVDAKPRVAEDLFPNATAYLQTMVMTVTKSVMESVTMLNKTFESMFISYASMQTNINAVTVMGEGVQSLNTTLAQQKDVIEAVSNKLVDIQRAIEDLSDPKDQGKLYKQCGYTFISYSITE